MDGYSQMQQTIDCKGRRLHFLAHYGPACCLAFCLAAAPSQAAPQARHGAGSKATSPAVRTHEGLLPNHRTNDVGSYHIGYVWPDKKTPAAVVISMHLDSYEDIKDGSGSFHKSTPKGIVVVKWHREWITLDASHPDGYCRSVDSEFAMFPAYTLTIDSPKALPVQLKTQQYSLYAMYLNGGLISKEAYFSGLSGEVDGDAHDAQRFRYTFPGGHNVIILQTPEWRAE